DVPGNGSQNFLEQAIFEGSLPSSIVQAAKVRVQAGFSASNFHSLGSAKRFADEADDAPRRFARQAAIFLDLRGSLAGDDQYDSHGHEGDQGNPNVDRQHGDDGEDSGDGRAHQVVHPQGEEGDFFYVVLEAIDGLAGRFGQRL